MVDANLKDEASKSELSHGDDATLKDEALLNSSNTMEEEDDEDEFEDEDEDDEEEEEDEDEEDEEDEEEEPKEEKVNDGEKTVVVTNNEEKVETTKENTVKKDAKKGEELKPKSGKKSSEDSKSKEKNPINKSKKKNDDSGTLTANGDKKPESSRRKKVSSKRVETMGMVFMCSSKTKADCFRYKILGLPESKKDQVLKIYRGMRLFLFDVDLRLMYGIFKAAGPGGYNIEPKAFKSEFPSQVRFTVLDDCLPLAEEKFKSILKENYYSRNKFEGLLKSDQVKKICKLFKEMGRGGSGSRSAVKSRRTRPAEPRRTRPVELRTSRADEKRKRWARDEERRPRSRSPGREKRRYTDMYDREAPVVYGREPAVVYDREPLLPRYRPPQPAASSPARLYTYEREPLDIPSYVRDRVLEPHAYRVVDRERDYVPEPQAYRIIDRERERDRERVPEPLTYRVVERERDPYLEYGRELPPPLYRDAVHTVPPPEYHLVSRDYHHPPAVEAPEYRLSGGSRVASYRDEIASDYRPAVGLPEYRPRTHYNY